MTAGFIHRTDPETRDWPIRVAFRLEAAPGPLFWFLPFDGGSDGQDKLASTTDPLAAGWQPPHPDGGPRPLGDLPWLLADDSYGIHTDGTARLRAGASAPAHNLIPDLHEALWYRTPSDRRIGVPTAFFDLTGCAAVSGG